MSYLFYIDEKSNLLLRPDCYKLHPKLKKLDEKEMLFVILATDYFSIYRQHPEQDRIRRAMFHVYDDYLPDLLKKPHIISAIEAYKGLQYDPNIEQVRKFQAKIVSLEDRLSEEQAPTTIKNILGSISELKASIRAIENEIIEKVQDEGQIKGDKKLSFIEKLTNNPKLYNAVKNNKPRKQVVDEA